MTRPLTGQRSRLFGGDCGLCSCRFCQIVVIVDCESAMEALRGRGKGCGRARAMQEAVEELTRRGWVLSFHWVPSHGRDPAAGWRPPEGFSEARVHAIKHRADRAASSACRRRVQGSGRQACVNERLLAKRNPGDQAAC